MTTTGAATNHPSAVQGLYEAGYQVQHSLGAGGGGDVYKAVQRSTGQIVAIKLLTIGETEPDAHSRRIERFRREINFCSTLYHPDIVRLVDSGTLEDNSRYAVFEYIPGRTLSQFLSEEKMLTVQRAKALMMQLLPPLAYAHGRHIAHRDLKPSNVMVIHDGGRDRIKILDFGISISTKRHEEDIQRLTRTNEWLCTPAYAAPEQLRGEMSGPKSDIYAWALMFVECLTGAALVTGKSLAEIIARQFDSAPHAIPPVLAQHRLGALLMRALTKDPSRRIGDAQLLASLLERISPDGLEDANGYLRDAQPISAPALVGRPFANTVTDSRVPEHTESRHVTVVCCRVSLVGAGGISSVEQIDALLDDSHALVNEVLSQFGGTPGQYAGGYSFWYFGLSQTRDGEARLAVRGALEVISRIEKLPAWFRDTGLALSIQVGVHAGPVTVQLSDGHRSPVDGLTARVALQLASVETDGVRASILVSDAFSEIVSRYAEFEPHGTSTVSAPWRNSELRVLRLLGESRASASSSEPTSFIGRSRELDALSNGWARAANGDRVAVLVTGEPGIGKSRLLFEFGRSLQERHVGLIEARCLPEWANASLRPFTVLLTHVLGITTKLPEDAGAIIEHRVAEAGLDSGITVPLLCAWLSVPLPPRRTPLAWSPQKQRQLLYEVIADLLLAQMASGNVLVVEDTHWADPSTLACVEVLLARSGSRGGMAVLTSRNADDGGSSAPFERIHLSGLDEGAASTLAKQLLPAESDALDIAAVVERCDGIPLFLEELAIARRAGPVRQTNPPTSRVRPQGEILQVPASLRALLTSRLDALEESKETAQFAAAVGREFSFDTLSALMGREELALAGDLEELVDAQILVKGLRLGSAFYFFRHALIRDAAYDSMPESTRRRVHERIAEGLERTPEAPPDVLAHHLERAGNASRAIEQWDLAAKKSNLASAHLEAVAQVDRAIELLSEMPDASRKESKEAELLLTRGAILVTKRGYTDPDARECFERIARSVPRHGDTLGLAFAARWFLWYYHNTRADLRESSLLADELHEIASGGDAGELSLTAWAAQCTSRFCTGRLEESVLAGRRCAAAYDFAKHRYLALSHGDDPCLASISFESLAELVRGRFAVARQRVDEGMALAEMLQLPSLVAGMHGQAAWMYLNLGSSGASTPELGRCLHHADSAVQLAREHGFPFWELYAGMIGAAARIVAGDPEATGHLQQGAGIWQSFGAALGRDWQLTFIAQGLQKAGDFDGALSSFDEAVEFCRARQSRYFEAEAMRQRAELYAEPLNPRRDVDRAVRECGEAADLAIGIGAHWWALASLVSAVRLRPDSYVGRLETFISRFPPGDGEPPLLVEARMRVTGAAGRAL